jgi:hypothetical protein
MAPEFSLFWWLFSVSILHFLNKPTVITLFS